MINLCKYLLIFLAFPVYSQYTKYPVPFELSSEDCLARNMYFEARAERSIYQIAAVGHVTLQRVKSKQWPNSICKVVYEQRKSKKGYWTPMFSWTNDNNSNIPKNLKAYNKCLKIARLVIDGTIKDKTKKATHYHNIYVDPYWASSMIKTASLGNHIFYK